MCNYRLAYMTTCLCVTTVPYMPTFLCVTSVQNMPTCLCVTTVQYMPTCLCVITVQYMPTCLCVITVRYMPTCLCVITVRYMPTCLCVITVQYFPTYLPSSILVTIPQFIWENLFSANQVHIISHVWIKNKNLRTWNSLLAAACLLVISFICTTLQWWHFVELSVFTGQQSHKRKDTLSMSTCNRRLSTT